MKRKKRIIKTIMFLITLAIIAVAIKSHSRKQQISKNNIENHTTKQETIIQNPKEIDWKLTLVNYENKLPDDFQIELADIDKTRKFDARAIGELNRMFESMKNDGITDVWVQSSYRSIEKQKKIFEDQVAKYVNEGKTKEEAEKLTMQVINKPGTSEHNLGLAVDFNYVDNTFEKTKGFKWLKENAQEYGFILRYPKEKENITKVTYEPWHWRYVGKENAKKIKEMGITLEEYVQMKK